MTEPVNLYYYIVSVFPDDDIPEKVIEWKSFSGYVCAMNQKQAARYIQDRYLYAGSDYKSYVVRSIQKVYLTNGLFL